MGTRLSDFTSASRTAFANPEVRFAPADSEPVQLVYQDWRTEWFPGLAQEMLAKFNETHPNIRVFYTPDPDNLETKMPEDMAAAIEKWENYFQEFLIDRPEYITTRNSMVPIVYTLAKSGS